MSELERAAKPLLLPMINGHRRDLTPPDQLVVARWACVKAVARNTDVRRRDRVFLVSTATRQALAQDHHLPLDMVVTLAAYERAFTFGVTSPFGVGTGSGGQPLAQFLTTLVLNHLVIQVFGRAGSVHAGVLEQSPTGFHNGKSFSVWPPQPSVVGWPPPLVIRDAELDTFTAGGIEEFESQIESVRGADRESAHPCANCGALHGPTIRALPV